MAVAVAAAAHHLHRQVELPLSDLLHRLAKPLLHRVEETGLGGAVERRDLRRVRLIGEQ